VSAQGGGAAAHTTWVEARIGEVSTESGLDGPLCSPGTTVKDSVCGSATASQWLDSSAASNRGDVVEGVSNEGRGKITAAAMMGCVSATLASEEIP